MNVKAVINEKYTQMEIHVCNDIMDDKVKDVATAIDRLVNDSYSAKAANGDSVPIYPKDIYSVYAENQKVFFKTAAGTFEATQKLYEIEESLDEKQFIRISRAEIVNIKKISRLDLGLTGTIKIIMSDGSESYTSRRNVNKLKKALCVK